jgi:hypothetical protein
MPERTISLMILDPPPGRGYNGREGGTAAVRIAEKGAPRMSSIVPFTDNIRDLSNETGYQFEFVCERCGNGYRAPFVPDKVAKGRNILRAVGSITGGRLADLGYASQMLDRSTNSPAKDRALQQSVESVIGEFRQCRGCGNWVCRDVCWNDEVGQCLNCSPSVADELSRAQAAAQVEQMHAKTREIDWTSDVDLQTRVKLQCPSCQASITGGKFCPECGSQIKPAGECANCGTEVKPGTKFCPECGQKQ